MVKDTKPKTTKPKTKKVSSNSAEGHILKAMLKEKGVKTAWLLEEIRKSEYEIDMPLPHLYRIFQNTVRVYTEEALMIIDVAHLDEAEYWRRLRVYSKLSCRAGRYAERMKKLMENEKKRDEKEQKSNRKE